MGAVSEALSAAGSVDFKAVREAANQSIELVLSHYLPGGRWESNEYVALNPTRHDVNPGSFKINRSGVWSDFATGERGGDLIDLVAFVTGKSKLDSARELAVRLNVSPRQGSTSFTGNVKADPKNRRKSANIAASPAEAASAPKQFPGWTAPNAEGKPTFLRRGEDGPRKRENEKRRHVYRQGGVPVKIKVMRAGADDAYNIYRVASDKGDVGWQSRKPLDFRAVPYVAVNCRSFDVEGQLCWPEGEKDVDTLSAAGLAAFTFGGVGDGLPVGCEEYVRDRDVVIFADNDEAGRKHADQKAVLASRTAKSVRVLHFPELQEKCDVSDWLPLHSVQELLDRMGCTQPWAPEIDPSEVVLQPAPANQEFKLPAGYRFRHHGLYCNDPNDSEKPDLWLSGCFDILAETRDGEGASWGLLLHWVDNDDRHHQFALSKALLAGDGAEARRVLLDGGLYVAPTAKARNLFNSFLLQARSPNRARATQRIGWHDVAFVLPDESFGGAENDKLLLQTATAHEHTFRQLGTLESWKEQVARYAVGNSRLILALSAAFAGPLIGPCSAEGGGVHFRGASSTGKSTALHVAGSVWGGGGLTGFVRSWRATSNGLEGVALAHCDTLLCLDELSQLAPKEAGEAAYMLANGSGKARSARDGSARRPATYRVLFLSSGEISLADKIAENGRDRRMAAGQRVRIVDVSADAGAGMGMFEELHGFVSADAMARHLREAAQRHYGVAGRTYLKEIVPVIGELQKQVAEIIKSFSEHYVPQGADGQVERVAQRFALIAAGGEVAARAGILPWNRGAALEAAGKIFEAWVEERGGSAPAEEHEGVEAVRAFLLANGQARFLAPWAADEDKRTVHNLAGFRQQPQAGEGWDYYINSAAWKEINAGLDPGRTARVLAATGFLDHDGGRCSKTVRVPGHGPQRLYHVLSSLLEDDEHA
jgi:putative DNA primase/helicase